MPLPPASPTPPLSFVVPIRGKPAAPEQIASSADKSTTTSGPSSHPHEQHVAAGRSSAKKLTQQQDKEPRYSLRKRSATTTNPKDSQEPPKKKKVSFDKDTKPGHAEESENETEQAPKWKAGSPVGNEEDAARSEHAEGSGSLNQPGGGQNSALADYQQQLMELELQRQEKDTERREQFKVGLRQVSRRTFEDIWFSKVSPSDLLSAPEEGAKAIELTGPDKAIGAFAANASFLICYAKLVVDDKGKNKRTFGALIQAAPPKEQKEINAEQSRDAVIKPLLDALQKIILEDKSIEAKPTFSEVEFWFLGANEGSKDFALATKQAAEEEGKGAFGKLPLNQNDLVTHSLMSLDGIFYTHY